MVYTFQRFNLLGFDHQDTNEVIRLCCNGPVGYLVPDKLYSVLFWQKIENPHWGRAGRNRQFSIVNIQLKTSMIESTLKRLFIITFSKKISHKNGDVFPECLPD